MRHMSPKRWLHRHRTRRWQDPPVVSFWTWIFPGWAACFHYFFICSDVLLNLCVRIMTQTWALYTQRFEDVPFCRVFRISVLPPGLFHNPSFYSHLTSGPNLPKKNVSFVGVFLRRNFNHNKEYTYTTLHWHHNAVSSLCFTPEGKHTLKSNSTHTFFIQTRISALFQVVSRFCVFFFLSRHQPAEWRCWICSRPVEIPGKPARLPAPSGSCHHAHHCLARWGAVLQLAQRQQ